MTIRKLASQGIETLSSLYSWVALTTRIGVGWVFIEAGWGKFHRIPSVIEYFRELGIPAPELQAPFVAFTELSCGLLFLVGLGSRLVSIPLAATMVVATLTAKREEIGTVSDLFGLSEVLYILLFLGILVKGPGVFSVDHVIRKKWL